MNPDTLTLEQHDERMATIGVIDEWEGGGGDGIAEMKRAQKRRERGW